MTESISDDVDQAVFEGIEEDERRHIPMHEVKRLMGHSSIRTTERFYLAASTDLARQVNDAFARIDDAEQSGVTESTG